MMRERAGARRGAGGGPGGAGTAGGAPFYAPPRRKTSAEIISEARAAVYGELPSAGGSSGSTLTAGSGSLRALPTRRPFTPRDPQRTLFERSHASIRDTRPPSAFSLKYLAAAADGGTLVRAGGARVASLDEDSFRGLLLTEPEPPARRKQLRVKARSLQVEEAPGGSGWTVFTKLPHLNGHSKPLHRRKNHSAVAESHDEDPDQLAAAICVTQPSALWGDLGAANGAASGATSGTDVASVAAAAASRRKQFSGAKSRSDEFERRKKEAEPRSTSAQLGTIAVKKLAVQLPNGALLEPDVSVDSQDTIAYRYSITEIVEQLFRKERLPGERVPQLLEALQAALQASGGAGALSQRLRESVLRALYCHVESEDERALVGIARIMLAMRVTGGNLSAACKLIFKVARNDKNDHLFKSTNLLELLVEGCGRACPLTEGECCVYGAGALRFLALEPSLREHAMKAGALHIAALHLKIINNAKSESPRSVSEQTTHALYQLTGALRNLAGGDKELEAFVTSGALPELVTTLHLFITDRDIVTNVTRTLSVASTDGACCAWLCASASSSRALVRALCACASHAPLAVRLAYTLGNMAAASETARLNIYSEPGAVDVLLTVMETQLSSRGSLMSLRSNVSEDPDVYLLGSDLAGSNGSSDDVLVKTVRVLANLCLAERVGRGLAAGHADRMLKALLDCCVRTEHLQSDDINGAREASEELSTAALATLNNLTFYHEGASESDGHMDPFDKHLDEMCRVACEGVARGASGRDVRAAREAVRALGNLTRAPRAARLAVDAGVLDALEPFLQHEEEGVRCAAAGVLVNVCGAGEARARGGTAAARGLAAAARARDTPAAALLARALWNAHAHAHAPLRPAHAAEAARALTELIDDDSMFAACEACEAEDAGDETVGLRRHGIQDSVGDLASIHDAKQERHLLSDIVKFDRAAPHDRGPQAPGYLEQDDGRNLDQGVQTYGDELGYDEDEYEEYGYSGEGAGEDLGFEEGDLGFEEGCECGPCVRLAAWEELIGVAIPLLEKLKPARADASVGTDSAN